jgi:hypothetical protein
MNAPAWRPITSLDRPSLHEARLQAHYALQWLARCARAYVPPQPNDSHTNLGWDEADGGFSTHPLPNGTRLHLRISDLTLVILNTAGRPQWLTLHDQTNADVRAWLGHELSAKGFDARKLDDPSPYDMPSHPIASGVKYSIANLVAALRDLSVWYANANSVLGHVRQQLVTRGHDAPEVRCWPHHFDLDSLISLGGDQTTGMGFAPGDEYYDEPYFYVSIYPEPKGMTLPEMPPIGHTHTHEFLAAIALASKIVAEKDQAKQTEAFVIGSLEVAIKLLGG